MQQSRVNNQPGDDVIKREISYYFELAHLYKKLLISRKEPYANVMLIEILKAASALDSAEAHYQLSEIFLDEAKFRLGLQNAGVFNSSANSQKCQQLFDEAHAHLLAAEQLGHIAAKRLRGLSIINGWGVQPDKNKGFELVVSSIEQEGSWDKVPQIFSAMGLNKPEFFAAIMQHRKEGM